MNYDQWKTRCDRPEDEPEDQGPSEAELAVIDAQYAFDVLIEWWGFERACQIMATIMKVANPKGES